MNLYAALRDRRIERRAAREEAAKTGAERLKERGYGPLQTFAQQNRTAFFVVPGATHVSLFLFVNGRKSFEERQSLTGRLSSIRTKFSTTEGTFQLYMQRSGPGAVRRMALRIEQLEGGAPQTYTSWPWTTDQKIRDTLSPKEQLLSDFFETVMAAVFREKELHERNATPFFLTRWVDENAYVCVPSSQKLKGWVSEPKLIQKGLFPSLSTPFPEH